MNDKPCKNCWSIGGNVGCDVCGPPLRERKARERLAQLNKKMEIPTTDMPHGDWCCCSQCCAKPMPANEEIRITATCCALDLAIRFHETYERLAPQFGHETRLDTRAFDPTSKNGKLMVAVCAEILEKNVNVDARRDKTPNPSDG